MASRIFGFCALLLLAAGCSGLSRPGAAAPENPATVAATPVPAPPADDFCARAAADIRARAVADGFDLATQERMTQQSFRQCAAARQD